MDHQGVVIPDVMEVRDFATAANPKPPGVPVYNTKQVEELFTGLTMANRSHSHINSHISKEHPDIRLPNAEELVLTISEKMTCSYCGVFFESRQEQKDHYKSDWHRFNLKLHLRGLPKTSEEEFDEITGDISSLSGSDSDDSSSDWELDPQNSNMERMTRKLLSIPSHLQPPLQVASSTDSESDREGYLMKRHPKVFFRNAAGDLLSIHRCVLHDKMESRGGEVDTVSAMLKLPSQTTWAVLMAGGGHFAAAIFDKDKVIEHKTFHRYVVRAKRGTAQSSRDKQGNAPKSAGASIRRHNEAALTQEIRELMGTWSDLLKKCDRIFLRAPSFNRTIFFGGKDPPFVRNDPRIRMIPFPTRRATFKEVQRVHLLLATVECYGKAAQLNDYIKVDEISARIGAEKLNAVLHASKNNTQVEPKGSPEVLSSSEDVEEIEITAAMETISTADLQCFGGLNLRKPKVRKKKPKDKISEDKDTSLTSDPEPGNIESFAGAERPRSHAKESGVVKCPHRNEMYTACKTGNADILQHLLSSQLLLLEQTDSTEPEENGEENRTSSSGLEDILNESCDKQGNTLLHVAAKAGHASVIPLLLSAGADPAMANKGGGLPFNVASTKAVRNEFRRFMSKNPTRYDYVSAQVPSPLTEEMEEERKLKEAERKKAQRKARKERLKEIKEEEKKQAAEETEKRRFAALSDREKRALAAERRILQQKCVDADIPVLSRCWQCGTDITGKVPFEYYDFRFCSPKCLKEHKLQNAKK